MKCEAWKNTGTPLSATGGKYLSARHNFQIAAFVGIGGT